MKVKYSVIIPTRERADVLRHSIKTCLSQQVDDFAVIISDNCSRDNTREVVESFRDPRLFYYKTDRRLSMSENYEFGISKVKQGYVCTLGDDDGLLPNAISDIDKIVSDTGLLAVNWKSDQYLWPSFRFNQRSNLLKISLNKNLEVLEGTAELQRLLNCQNGYERVPWLYKGFVHVSAIDAVKRRSGKFFHSMIPDVYSGIALANVIDRYVYSYKPFALDAVSNHSNGASYNMDTDDKTAAAEFLSETNIPMHEGFSYNQSAYLLTAESIYQAISHGVMDASRYKIDLMVFFKAALLEVRADAFSRYQNVVEAIRNTARHFDLPQSDVDQLISSFPSRPSDGKYNVNVEGYNIFKNRIEVNAEKFGVSNVYDATLLHQSISEKPEEYLRLTAKVISTAKFVLREIGRRYL